MLFAKALTNFMRRTRRVTAKTIMALSSKSPSLFLLAFFFVSNLTVSAAIAATYYVSTSGNDANNGLSSSSPWRSLKKVSSSTFQPGDQILLRRNDTWLGETLRVPTSGAVQNHITFGAYGTGALPKIDGNGGNDNFGIVQVRGKSYITIENLEITNMAHAVFLIHSGAAPVTDVIVRNCLIHTNRAASNMFGVQNFNEGTITPLAEGRATNILIEGNTIHSAGHNTLVLNGGVTNSIVRNNLIYNYAHNGIDIKAAETSTSRNRNIQIIGNRIIGGPPGTFQQTGIFAADIADSLLDGNIVSGNTDSNIKSHHWQSSPRLGVENNTFRRNIVYNSESINMHISEQVNAKIYNNTYWNAPHAALHMHSMTNLQRANELAYGHGSGNTPGFDPRWADRANGDFRLCTAVGVPVASCQSASQAIDAGVDVGLPFHGKSPDLGALETGPSLPSVLNPPSNLTVVVP